jgi:hypothetical protein
LAAVVLRAGIAAAVPLAMSNDGRASAQRRRSMTATAEINTTKVAVGDYEFHLN